MGTKLPSFSPSLTCRGSSRLAARWQGFPDEFRLHPKADRAYYQLGNSVSINVVEAVARSLILNLIGGEPGRKYSLDESSG